jgi:hypothetical protein
MGTKYGHQRRHTRRSKLGKPFPAGHGISLKYMDTSKEIKNVIGIFNDFKVIDYDDNYAYLRKDGVGVVEARVIRGSLGEYYYKFVVEKFGERSKLFSGKNAITKIRQYLR